MKLGFSVNYYKSLADESVIKRLSQIFECFIWKGRKRSGLFLKPNSQSVGQLHEASMWIILYLEHDKDRVTNYWMLLFWKERFQVSLAWTVSQILLYIESCKSERIQCRKEKNDGRRLIEVSFVGKMIELFYLKRKEIIRLPVEEKIIPLRTGCIKEVCWENRLVFDPTTERKKAQGIKSIRWR